MIIVLDDQYNDAQKPGMHSARKLKDTVLKKTRCINCRIKKTTLAPIIPPNAPESGKMLLTPENHIIWDPSIKLTLTKLKHLKERQYIAVLKEFVIIFTITLTDAM